MKRLLAALALGTALAVPPGVPGQERAAAPPSPSAIDPEKLELIDRFLQVTNAYRFYDDIVGQVCGAYAKRFPQIEKDFWTDFRKNHTRREDLFNTVIPIYAKYLSTEDLRSILEFFESPAGKKYVAVLGDLGRETGMVALDFERDLNSRILKRLKEAGY
jgi:hypothetical protein